MASRSLGEAILRALAGAGQELGGQMQENQKFNLQRGDMFERLKTDREERRRGAERDQFESDRAYDFNVKKTEDQGIGDFLKGIEEKNRYATKQGWLEKQFMLDQQREGRLGRGETGGTTKAHPAGTELVKAFRGSRKKVSEKDGQEERMVEAPYNQAGLDTLMSLKMTGQFPERSKQLGWGGPAAQFFNPRMSAVAELNPPGPQGFNNTKMSQASFRDLNQPDQNGLQQAFQQQLPPDFNEWPPEDQQAAWEMFLEMQGQ